MKNGLLFKNGKFTTLTSRLFHRVGEGELDGVAILTGFLKTAYKLDQTAIDSILKHGKIAKDGETLTDAATPETILATLTELDKARIVKLKTDTEKDSYQKGYTKAKGEVLTEHEREIKEKYGVESNLKGQELYDFILAEKLKGSGGNEDDIKKSVTYQQMEARMKKELKEAKEAGDNKVKEMETTYKKEGTFSVIGEYSLSVLDTLNPIKATNPTVEAQRRKDFLNELKNGYSFEVHEDGTKVPMRDGKVMTDEHGNTLSMDDLVKTIAGNRFEFPANNGGENGGAKNDPKGKGGAAGKTYPAGVTKPKNIEELTALTASTSKLNVEDRRIVLNEYRERTAAK